MTPEQLFSALNLMAVAAWLLLLFLPRVRWTATVLPVVTPFLFGVLYVGLLAATLGRSEGGFSSLAGVRALFDNPWALLAGWTHYLAFDLFLGRYIWQESLAAGKRARLPLLLTWLAGPMGFTLFLARRVRWNRAS